MRSDGWIICPNCRCEIREGITPGRLVVYRCPVCHWRFRAYLGKTALFARTRHREYSTYYALLTGATFPPKLFVIKDETPDEMIINRGDRVVVVYRRGRPAIIQNLSHTTYWVIHDVQPTGFLPLLTRAIAVAGVGVLLATGLRR
jgi:hypothetical protein